MPEIIGTKENPYHLSFGILVIDDCNNIMLLKKRDGMYKIPTETVKFEETIEESVKRGAAEELGLKIDLIKYLGVQISFFNRLDGSIIEKTTCYFLAKKSGVSTRVPEKDEIYDILEWKSLSVAVKLFENLGQQLELNIIKRI
jgi:isopentenyldiphosphate isomerase